MPTLCGQTRGPSSRTAGQRKRRTYSLSAMTSQPGGGTTRSSYFLLSSSSDGDDDDDDDNEATKACSKLGQSTNKMSDEEVIHNGNDRDCEVVVPHELSNVLPADPAASSVQARKRKPKRQSLSDIFTLVSCIFLSRRKSAVLLLRRDFGNVIHLTKTLDLLGLCYDQRWLSE